jgi:TfoX/Sxy family transcriptional regulator of competence genes
VAYDEALAGRIRAMLAAEPGLTEMRMFGGLAFLVNGNMAVAAGSAGALMVRAARDEYEALVSAGDADPVLMRDRPMRGWLEVDRARLGTDEQLTRWVDLGVGYARTLPPKRS